MATYQVAPSDSCSGAVDSTSAIGDTRVPTGWAWDRATGRGATAILFADSAGAIRGAGVVGLPRPDVKKARTWVTTANVGWHGFTSSRRDLSTFMHLPSCRTAARCVAWGLYRVARWRFASANDVSNAIMGTLTQQK